MSTGASIKEKSTKIKAFLGDEQLFTALLVVVVGLASFGLGRLSVLRETPLEGPPEVPVSQHVGVVVRQQTAPSGGEVTVTPGAYVGSKNSNKYHLPWCPGAETISEANRVWFKTKAEAEAAGYIPAGNCKGI